MNEAIFEKIFVLWKAYPIEEAAWVQTLHFSHPKELRHYLEEGSGGGPKNKRCNK